MTPTTKKYKVKLESILERGMSLLWSNGYHATSVNDIVSAANVPKGSFYHYFKSKEDFVLKALNYYYKGQVLPGLETLEDTSKTPKERLLSFYENRAATVKGKMNCQKGCLAGNLASEIAEHNEAVRLELLQKHNLIINKLTSVIQQAQENGEINTNLPAVDLAEFIEDSTKGAMISMKEMKSPYPIDNHLKMVRDILLV